LAGKKEHLWFLGGQTIMNMSMVVQSQLLATKFFMPTVSGTLISRPRLSSLLAESLKYPLTLISAPAGFGKTMLLSSWAQSLPANQALVAWVSLDEEDNEPRLFWTYVLSALDQQQAERLTPLLKYLQSPETPPLMYVLTILINRVLDSQEHLVLILDDYHLITEQQVHTTLSYLIEHLPPQLHIILATRVDPPLPLSQLRTHQQLLEVRTEHLCCTVEETKAFFKQVMNTQLPEEMIQEVTARTEGWLVGLHLLALSLQGRLNPATLLEEVSGDQRYILDYLTEEVLQRQSPEMQTFLLSTCILQRLTAPLCDAVVQRSGSQQMLEWLEQANLFVVSLDSKRQWYRYHALFAEALRYRLEQTHADLVLILHHRASLWYAEHDQTTEAILHAFYAKEWQWAADLIEQRSLPMMSLTWGVGEHEMVLLRQWLEQLPADIVQPRPRLCLACCQLLWAVAPQTKLQAWFDAAQTSLTASLMAQTQADVSSSILTLQARQELENLLGEVIALRAILQSYQEDGQTALPLCQQALALLSADNLVVRAHVTHAQLLASYVSSANDAVAAIESGFQASSLAQEAEQTALALLVMGSTAVPMLGAGQLHEAQRLTLQATQLGTQLEGLTLPEVGLPAILQADILREWNQLDAAMDLAGEAISLCQQTESVASLAFLLPGYAVLLRIHLSCGDLDAARSVLQQYEQICVGMNQPTYIYIHSLLTTIDQVRLWLACGELDRATRWAEELDLRERHGTVFAHEREEVACARIFLATGLHDLALQRLEPGLQRATAGQRWGHVIEIRLLQALAHQMLHEVPQALSVLSEAIRLAEPEGYIRSFVDEGVPMAALLSQLREQQHKAGPTPYLDTLLTAFQEQSQAQKCPPRRRR